MRFQPEHADDFAALYNAGTFEKFLIDRGVAVESSRQPMVWEASADNGSWNAYDEDVNAQIDAARNRGLSSVEVRSGPRGWKYEIDFKKMVQRNPKTKKERPLRCVMPSGGARRSSGAPTGGGTSTSTATSRLPIDSLRKEINHFVELATLPASPNPGGPSSRIQAM